MGIFFRACVITTGGRVLMPVCNKHSLSLQSVDATILNDTGDMPVPVYAERTRQIHLHDKLQSLGRLAETIRRPPALQSVISCLLSVVCYLLSVTVGDAILLCASEQP